MMHGLLLLATSSILVIYSVRECILHRKRISRIKSVMKLMDEMKKEVWVVKEKDELK